MTPQANREKKYAHNKPHMESKEPIKEAGKIQKKTAKQESTAKR